MRGLGPGSTEAIHQGLGHDREIRVDGRLRRHVEQEFGFVEESCPQPEGVQIGLPLLTRLAVDPVDGGLVVDQVEDKLQRRGEIVLS